MNLKNKNDAIKKELLEKNINAELVGDVKNRATPTEFRCTKCNGIFVMTPHNLIINRQNCTICGPKRRWTYSDVEKFINEFDSDNYKLLSAETELLDKKNNKISTNLYANIYHKKCNNVSRLRLSHVLHDHNFCSYCNVNAKTYEKFKNDIYNIYGEAFIVESKEYNGRRKDISLKCTKCGNVTTDKAFNFITNHRGCSFCNAPVSEQIILSKFPNIEHNVSDIINESSNGEKSYSYDFRMNDILLECDGDQHFRSVKLFGGDEQFKIQLEHDYYKNLTVMNKNKRLIRIYSKEITSEKIDLIFNSSTTNEMLSEIFKNILIIDEGNIVLKKGLYIGLASATLKQVEMGDIL